MATVVVWGGVAEFTEDTGSEDGNLQLPTNNSKERRHWLFLTPPPHIHTCSLLLCLSLGIQAVNSPRHPAEGTRSLAQWNWNVVARLVTESLREAIKKGFLLPWPLHVALCFSPQLRPTLTGQVPRPDSQPSSDSVPCLWPCLRSLGPPPAS